MDRLVEQCRNEVGRGWPFLARFGSRLGSNLVKRLKLDREEEEEEMVDFLLLQAAAKHTHKKKETSVTG